MDKITPNEVAAQGVGHTGAQGAAQSATTHTEQSYTPPMESAECGVRMCEPNAQSAPRTEKQMQRAMRNLELDLIEERLSPLRVDVTKPYEEPEPIIAIGDMCICSQGNISAIVGESKSKKTFLASALIASTLALPRRDDVVFGNVSNNLTSIVLWLDTEQSQMHIRKVIKRVDAITGFCHEGVAHDPRVQYFSLRELTPYQRLATLRDALRSFPFNLVVIDGIADLVNNINDVEESEAVVGELMALSTLYNCHIVCILHTNPGTDKARGHLGSALQRKCETVLFVHRVGEVSVVEPQFCRNEPFERFAFMVNEDGLPILCDLPGDNGEGRVESIVRERFGGSAERNTLINKMVELLGISRRAAIMRISRLLKAGKLRDTDGVLSIAS